MEYTVKPVFYYEQDTIKKILLLLHDEGLNLDRNLDRTYGIFDSRQQLCATGSAYKNTLRCIAVKKELQGAGLLALLISTLVADRSEQGLFDLFVYTKAETAPFFRQMGFYPIVTVENRLVFMENKKDGFRHYCNALKTKTEYASPRVNRKKNAAIVMNANPFTFGHAHLLDTAAAQTDLLHLFIVSDDSSVIPFPVRKQLIQSYIDNKKNILLHDTGSYLISAATFPSYFLQDSDEAISVQAALDSLLFVKIAQHIGITDRFVGEEPFSTVTNRYNTIMHTIFMQNDIQLHVIPRKCCRNTPISASQVRLLLKEEQWEALQQLIPPETLAFFRSPEAAPILKRLHQTDTLVHY